MDVKEILINMDLWVILSSHPTHGVCEHEYQLFYDKEMCLSSLQKWHI